MSRSLFGTDGVRGLAGQYPLDAAGARRIGMAVGTHFAQSGQTVVIGQDPRESSKQLVADLVAGLTAVGVNVVKAGVLPTPGLAYLTREHAEFVAGVMVTASHNPYEFNGVKVFDAQGGKLPDDTEMVMNRLIEAGLPERGTGQVTEDAGLVRQYEDFLVGSAPGLRLNGFRLAVDAANGAGSGIAGSVFKRLGAEAEVLFNQPDGKNINAGCGATDTKALQQAVKDQAFDVGIALDGDADRVIMVDHLGREVKGDYLLYILGITMGLKGVVATVMSNQGFEDAMVQRGIKFLRTAVGDRYVLEGLLQTGYKLGGEEAGHIIIADLLQTGDGLLAAVQVLKALHDSNKSLAAWCDEVKLMPQSLINLPVGDKSVLQRPDVQAYIDQQAAQLEVGRLLIRPSGTEPLVRVMVEAPDAELQAKRIAAGLADLLKERSAV